jgi:ketosteroid isomerase-like protein
LWTWVLWSPAHRWTDSNFGLRSAAASGARVYMATWDEFLGMQAKPVQFDFPDIAVTAGADVAFATAIGTCCDLSSGVPVNLEFRLTMGFRKIDGKWRIVHEHHSIPAPS